MTPAQFVKIRLKAGLSPGQLSELIRTTERSVYRWEDGTRKIPGPVALLMELIRDRILPQ